MPIDRSFIVQGHGTVVTGSVLAGSVRVGDEIEWLPQRPNACAFARCKITTRPVDEVHRGMRAAINLAGVDHKDVVRGQELATPGYLSAVARRHRAAALPARDETADQASRRRCAFTSAPPRSWAPCPCSIATPSSRAAGAWRNFSWKSPRPQPGASRSSSAARRRRSTIGGGQVLQPVAKKIRRRHLEILERIEKLWTGDAEAARPDRRLVRRLCAASRRPISSAAPTYRARQALQAHPAAARRKATWSRVTLHGGAQIVLHADIIARTRRAHPQRAGQNARRVSADDLARSAKGASPARLRRRRRLDPCRGRSPDQA